MGTPTLPTAATGVTPVATVGVGGVAEVATAAGAGTAATVAMVAMGCTCPMGATDPAVVWMVGAQRVLGLRGPTPRPAPVTGGMVAAPGVARSCLRTPRLTVAPCPCKWCVWRPAVALVGRS